jgi:chromate transporter
VHVLLHAEPGELRRRHDVREQLRSVAPALLSDTPPLGRLLAYFLRLGTLGFGGPIALCAAMERDLVVERRWFGREEYAEGLALAQLAPGPLAAQLAIYLGWLRAGLLGATLVAVAFVLPSFVMVLALSALYVRFGGLPGVQGVFYGIGAAVIGVIVRGAYGLVRRTLQADVLLWAIAAAAGTFTAWTESEVVWVFLAGGLVALAVRGVPALARRRAPLALVPVWLVAGLSGPATRETLWTVWWYFAEAGAFVFGSGLAIVPFLYGGVVERFHWLTERQFLDAVAVAMITPGPVVITTGFIGYLVAGPLGAVVAALGVFLPCYLFVVVLAPSFRRVVANPGVKAFVAGVTAAATGAIAGAAVVLGRRAIVDVPTAALALAVLAVLVYGRRVPEPALIVAAGVAGLLLKGA